MDDSFSSDFNASDSEEGAIIALYESAKKKSEPRFFDVADYETIIEHYVSLFDIPSATNAIRKALEQHPGSLELKYHEAQLAYMAGDADRCLHLISTLRLIHPEDTELEVLRAEALAMRGETKRAIRLLDRVLVQGKEADRFKLNHLIAKLHMQHGDHLDAIPYWKAALEEVPMFDHAYTEMKDCYIQAGLLEEALEVLEKALDENPYSTVLWMEKGLCLFEEEQYEKAVEAFEFALAIEEDWEPAMVHLASSLFNAGRYKEAIEVYNRLLEGDDSIAAFHCSLGECYEQMEEMERAEAYFHHALQLDPEYADARLGLCVVLESRGEHIKALRQVENAVGLHPENSEYWLVYAVMLGRIGSHDKAMTSFERAAQLDREDVSILHGLLDYLIEAEMLEESLARVERGFEEYGEDSGIYLRGIRTLFALGRIEECIVLVDLFRSRISDPLDELQEYFPELFEDPRFKDALSD